MPRPTVTHIEPMNGTARGGTPLGHVSNGSEDRDVMSLCQDGDHQRPELWSYLVGHRASLVKLDPIGSDC